MASPPYETGRTARGKMQRQYCLNEDVHERVAIVDTVSRLLESVRSIVRWLFCLSGYSQTPFIGTMHVSRQADLVL
jgi:hypothetical protein